MYQDILDKLNKALELHKRSLKETVSRGFRKYHEETIEELLNKILFYESLSIAVAK